VAGRAFIVVPVILVLLISLIWLWHETAELGGRLRDAEMQRDRFAGDLASLEHEMANQTARPEKNCGLSGFVIPEHGP
jgi:hypothetical protein